MDVVTQDAENFETYKSSLLDQDKSLSPLYQKGNLAYYQAYFQHDFKEKSFIIHYKKKPLLLLLVTESIDQECSYFGLPIQLIWRNDAASDEKKGAIKLAIKQFEKTLNTKENSINHIVYKDMFNSFSEDKSNHSISEFSLYLLKKGFPAVTAYSQTLHLQQSEDLLLADVRKNYRADIRWGEKNMHFKLIDCESISKIDISEFRDLHVSVSGKETRSMETWQKQHEFIESNEGFILFGYLDGKLVAASLFIHNENLCYYGVGAYRRELFDKPISHALVWRGVMHAKALGCQQFEFGEAFFPTKGTDKEIAISRFKQGFGGDIVSYLSF